MTVTQTASSMDICNYSEGTFVADTDIDLPGKDTTLKYNVWMVVALNKFSVQVWTV